ncbi:MAG: hypothetical protein V3S29_10525, partial [bacterium]
MKPGNSGAKTQAGGFGGTPPRRGPLRRRGAGLWAVVLTVLAVLWVGGCGYGGDPARLPGNAASLAIGAVRNLTYTGELDLRLIGALRARLSRNPYFLLAAPGQSELVLDVDLKELQVSRALVFSTTNADGSTTNLRMTSVLTGRIVLRHQGPGGRAILQQDISASSVLI